MTEHEAEEELDAAIAVYGSSCNIIRRSPPHLVVRLQPRTADDISKQYVEAVLVIKADDKYPQTPPMLELKDTKGLDEVKVTQLASELENLANMLIFNPMLVSICEAALDRLTEMNQPDGNCCFCMDSLVLEDGTSELRTFIKLLSCFHCFHSDCFGRWWRWVLEKRGVNYLNVFHSLGPKEDPESLELIVRCTKLLEEIELKCPACRKLISAQDLTSVWNVLAADHSPNQDQEEKVADEEHDVMFSESEVERKARFDEILRVQQSCGGVIEPKKLEVLIPGMFVSVPSTKNPSCSEARDEAAASSGLQASDSSSSETATVTEAEPLSQNMDNLRLGAEQQALNMRTSEATESTRKFNAQSEDYRRRKGGRHNYAGGKKEKWIRRDQEGGK